MVVEHVVDPELWRVLECELQLGAQVHEACKAPGLVLVPTSAPTPLLRYSAGNGFPYLTVFSLKKLRAFLNLQFAKGKTPKSEIDWVKALGTHVLGELSEARWQRMMQHRRLDPSQDQLLQESLLAASGNEEVLARSMANTDLQEPMAQVVAAAAAAQPREQRVARGHAVPAPPTPPAEGGAAAASSHEGPRQPPRIDYDIDDTIEAKEAQKLLPQNGKYKLSKDKTLHMRWQLKWNDQAGQLHHFSRGWGPRSSNIVRSSLRLVLQEAWQDHERCSGEACPYSFREVL